MRAAPTNTEARIWARLLATVPQHRVTHLRLSKSEIFADQTVELDQVTILVGAHGSGKTAFLRALETALGGGRAAQFPPFTPSDLYGRDDDPPRLKGICEVSVMANGASHTKTVNITLPREQLDAIWRDVGISAYFCNPINAFDELIMLYHNWPHAMQLVPDLEPDRLNREDTQALGRILGRAYEEVTYYVFQDDIDLVGTSYVRARIGQKWVDSGTMSVGELWVNYVINWAFRYANPGEIILIDEPETFVSRRGQRSFVNEIARYARRQRIQVVIATHAPDAYSYVPLRYFRVCLPTQRGVQLVVPRSPAELQDAVGAEIPLYGIVLVEDDMAARMLRTLLAAFNPFLRKSIEVFTAGGVKPAMQTAQVMQGASRFRCAVVLDGDQRDRQHDPSRVPVLFLPGSRQPEDELLDAARNAPETLIKRLRCGSEALYVLDDALRFAPHQAWWRQLSRRLAVDEPALVDALIHLWLDDPVNSEKADHLVSELADHLLPAR